METTTDSTRTFNVPQLKKSVNIKLCPKCIGGKMFLENAVEDGLSYVCYQCGFRLYPHEPMPLVDIRELID